MYCRKCYSPLDRANEPYRCPKCGRGFIPANPKTYLARPFPSKSAIALQIIGTTIIGIIVAFIVAMFQGVYASGH